MPANLLRAAVLTALLTPALLAQRQILAIQGTQPGEEFGATLSSIGDRDGDGRADLVIGAPTHDLGATTDVGQVTVVSSRTGTTLAVRFGTSLNQRLGTAVQGLGDSNGDGIPDFAASSPTFALNSGLVVVCSGLTGLPLATFTGEPLSEFGTALADVGDITGDGLADLAVGAPHNSPLTASGTVRFFSVPHGLHGQLTGSTGARFGQSLAAIGDLNGDGHPELAIGSPDQPVLNFARGRVTLVDPMLSGAASVRWAIDGSNATGFYLGNLVAAGGDLTQDGVPDLLAGDADRIALEVSGANGAFLGQHTSRPFAIHAACGLGDIDGDGRADFALGLPEANFGDGRVEVYLGSGGSFSMDGTPGSRFGSAITGLGDVDGDGRADFAVGAPGYPVSGLMVGRVTVHTMSLPWWNGVTVGGCPGESGIAQVGLTAAPVLGNPCSLRAQNLHPQHPGVWLLGFSNTTVNGQSLPLSLLPFGFPGCMLRTSAEVVALFLPGGATTADYPLPTHNPAIVGMWLYCQTSQLGPNGGLSMSTMLNLLLGNV